MEMNEDGLRILKQCEGLCLKSYNDPCKIPTIGFGTIIYPSGKKVQLGESCTEAQAIEWLNYELKEKAATIANWTKNNNIKLTDNQFSALLCFSYNCGTYPITNSESSLNIAIRSGDIDKIKKAFLLYNKATVKVLGIKIKKELRGLTIRRNLEYELYAKN